MNTTTPRRSWAGEAAGDHWQLELTGISEGPLFWPDSEVLDGEEIVDGSHTIQWMLVFVSGDGRRAEAWWDPVQRILGGIQLRGWSKLTINALKRHLIELGERP